jgi:hypothetical protein
MIGVDQTGAATMDFNTKGMWRGWCNHWGVTVVGKWGNKDVVHKRIEAPPATVARPTLLANLPAPSRRKIAPLSSTAEVWQPFAAVDSVSFALDAPNEGSHVPIYTTHQFSTVNEDVVRVVIPLQGSRRMAWPSWMSARAALQLEPKALQGSTAIVNLHFQVGLDSPDPGCVRWLNNEDWRACEYSAPLEENGNRVSAIDCIEQVVSRMARDKVHFPNLREVVFTGHSAGGQLAARLALLSTIDPVGTDGKGAAKFGTDKLAFKYVCGNPSSYMYLTPERAISDDNLTFEVPVDAPKGYSTLHSCVETASRLNPASLNACLRSHAMLHPI